MDIYLKNYSQLVYNLICSQVNCIFIFIVSDPSEITVLIQNTSKLYYCVEH